MLKSFFIPSKENNFLPKIIGCRALIFYALISFTIFLLLSPFYEIKINNILADLTQELIVKQVNPIREEKGFLKLQINEKLSNAAQLKAEDMIKRGYFSHTGPNGERPWTWLEKAEYNYAAAGENLAIDCSDPKVLINAWLKSPLHRKNILNGYFSDVGIGIAKGIFEGRKTVVTVMFLGKEITEGVNLITNEEVKEIYENTQKQPESLAEFSTDLTQDVLPEEPVVVTTVDENTLLKQNIIIAGRQEANPEISEEIELKPTEFKLFLINEFPSNARFVLSIFLSFVILWVLTTFFIKKDDFLMRAVNSLIAFMFLLFIWLPEIL